jgi:hypothetical protein
MDCHGTRLVVVQWRDKGMSQGLMSIATQQTDISQSAVAVHLSARSVDVGIPAWAIKPRGDAEAEETAVSVPASDAP